MQNSYITAKFLIYCLFVASLSFPQPMVDTVLELSFPKYHINGIVQPLGSDFNHFIVLIKS